VVGPAEGAKVVLCACMRGGESAESELSPVRIVAPGSAHIAVRDDAVLGDVAWPPSHNEAGEAVLVLVFGWWGWWLFELNAAVARVVRNIN